MKKHNRTPGLYWHESVGNTKMKLKTISFISFWVGRDGKTKNRIKFPFKRKACQVYRVGYGRGRIW